MRPERPARAHPMAPVPQRARRKSRRRVDRTTFEEAARPSHALPPTLWCHNKAPRAGLCALAFAAGRAGAPVRAADIESLPPRALSVIALAVLSENAGRLTLYPSLRPITRAESRATRTFARRALAWQGGRSSARASSPASVA